MVLRWCLWTMAHSYAMVMTAQWHRGFARGQMWSRSRFKWTQTQHHPRILRVEPDKKCQAPTTAEVSYKHNVILPRFLLLLFKHFFLIRRYTQLCTASVSLSSSFLLRGFLKAQRDKNKSLSLITHKWESSCFTCWFHLPPLHSQPTLDHAPATQNSSVLDHNSHQLFLIKIFQKKI